MSKLQSLADRQTRGDLSGSIPLVLMTALFLCLPLANVFLYFDSFNMSDHREDE